MEYVYDPYIWTDELKILTNETLNIPGLEMFGHYCLPRKLAVILPHIHETTEFLYLVSGAQRYCIGEKEYVLRGNQVVVVDEDVVHSSGSNPYGRYEHLWFRMDVETFAQHLGVSEHMKLMICSRLRKMPSPIIELRDNQYSNLRSAFYHLASHELTDQLCGYTEFVEFIAQLVRCTDPSCVISPGIQRVITYIQENICAYIGLEELAKVAGLSLSGFKQKFRREMGITPREYINLKKIEKAKTCLASGISVTKTAFLLDFSSSSYFSVLFRQMEDMTPSEYIKKHSLKKEL